MSAFFKHYPDHISPIEHPTFDDYFYCKRQLITHSKVIVLNHEADYFPLLKETAQQQKSLPLSMAVSQLQKLTIHSLFLQRIPYVLSLKVLQMR